MAIRMQQRRGTLSQWAAANPVLAAGEIGWESDTNKFKMGDGVNQWADLDYFIPVTPDAPSLDDYVPLNIVGEPDGVASLDSTGNVPASQLGNATVDLSSYATQTYVDTAVSGLVDAAPGLLDTLNELAAAIGDDANFVTTVNTAIADGDAATLSAAEDYADGLAANYDVAGAAAASEAAANLYTDNAIAAIPPVDLTGYATETYVNNAVSNLVDSAPATLDTLNELAAALNDDANFATTVTNSLAGKAPLASPTFTGTVDFSSATVQGLNIPQPIHPFVMLG